MELYKTIARRSEAEQVIDRSRFIARACPVESREEAENFIKDIRSLEKQATHNVPAFIIGAKQELKWTSDDGEPQGTSGPPMLQLIEKEGLTNLVVVVTRYYGGIKLGTGGLVRAYSTSAKMAVEAAGICIAKEMKMIQLTVDYSVLPKLQNMAQAQNAIFTIENISYTDVAMMQIMCAVEDAEAVKTAIMNASNGTAKIGLEEEIIASVPV